MSFRYLLPAIAGLPLAITPALAQAPTPEATPPLTPTDTEFLDGFYTSLEGEDAFAHFFATELLDNNTNIYLAQTLCEQYDEGLEPMGALEFVVSTVASVFDEFNLAEEVDNPGYSNFVYSVAMVSYGAEHYCPQYIPEVQTMLRALAEELGE